MNGIINVLKPAGMTSHDVVSLVRRVYGIKKVGHAGTLDPLAAGVLPIFIGKATRLLEFIQAEPKIYVAEWLVGLATDTEDTSGTVCVIDREAARLAQADWEGAASRFKGRIRQRPSLYSAVKVAGRKAYELARKRENVELPAREVTIYAIEGIEWEFPVLRSRVTCSSGTYIRALGRDWAHAVGTEMTMSFLLREAFGPTWHVNKAVTLEEVEADPQAVLIPPTAAVSHLLRAELSPHKAEAFRNGVKISFEDSSESGIRSVWTGADFVGIAAYDAEAHLLSPRKVWVEE